MNERDKLVAEETQKHLPLVLEIFGEEALASAFEDRERATEYMANHEKEIQEALDQITVHISDNNYEKASEYAQALPDYIQHATITLWMLFIEEKVRRSMGMQGVSERLQQERAEEQEQGEGA